MVLFNKASNIIYCAATLTLACFLALGADPPRSVGTLLEGEICGSITNEFCSGVLWETKDLGKIIFQDVIILVRTTKTNGTYGYFVPPGEKLAKAELREANGVLVVPLRGKKLDDDLPLQIKTKDLPRYPQDLDPQGGRGAGGLIKNRLWISPNLPSRFSEFYIRDIYHIEKEGDYTFTFIVSIYHLTNDKQAVVRMDLPSLSVQMHLTASPK